MQSDFKLPKIKDSREVTAHSDLKLSCLDLEKDRSQEKDRFPALFLSFSFGISLRISYDLGGKMKSIQETTQIGLRRVTNGTISYSHSLCKQDKQALLRNGFVFPGPVDKDFENVAATQEKNGFQERDSIEMELRRETLQNKAFERGC